MLPVEIIECFASYLIKARAITLGSTDEVELRRKSTKEAMSNTYAPFAIKHSQLLYLSVLMCGTSFALRSASVDSHLVVAAAVIRNCVYALRDGCLYREVDLHRMCLVKALLLNSF